MMMSAGILGGTTFADTTVGELAPTLPPDSLLPFSAPESVVVLVLTPLVILVLALIFGVVLPRRRRRAMRHGPIPIAPFGRGDVLAIPPRPTRPSPSSVVAQESTEETRKGSRDGVREESAKPSVQSERAAPVIPIEMRAMELDQTAREDRGRVLRMHVAGERRDVYRDERSAVTLRLERPQDGTLQFLPGRLEVVEGGEEGQEIKFVRTPGPDGTTITFGRAEGAQYRHVQLHVPTVSRMHAKLFLDGQSWSLINLSATNPVVVNGLPLAGEGSSVILREGDRIEMGEVVFRFRAK